MSKLKIISLIFLLIIVTGLVIPEHFSGQPKPDSQYQSPPAVAENLKKLARSYADLCQLSSIGKSYGGLDIYLLEIAAGRNKTKPDQRPAVLVVANSEGLHLPGTEAALGLAETILSAYGKDNYWTGFLNDRTIYIVPLLNPDAATAYFVSPRQERSCNGRPVDDDNDGLVDEDGPEDLNGDGLITRMRVKSPEGHWIIDPNEPRLMRPAGPKKGEKGEYLLYIEGYDNDADGEINEDGPGGVEINRNFLHDFEYYDKRAGLYPASEPETQALLQFMFDHNHLSGIINFSTENNLLNLQQTGRARAGTDRVRVPSRYAAFLGLEPDTEYGLKEIAEAMKSSGMVGAEVEIDENLVATFLGLGPAMTLDRSDQAIYEELQKEYKIGLKEIGLDYLEKNARGVGQGSFPAFCYYQYGVPVFSFDLWQVPETKKSEKREGLTPDRIKSMSSEEFLTLGEEKIAAFLKEQGAPPNLNAGRLIKMVESGQLTPVRIAEMMAKRPGVSAGPEKENPEAYLLNYSDTVLKGKGFVGWKAFNHQDLGQVEIGGFVPYLRQVPPLEELQSSLKFHIQFSQKLMQKLPVLSVKETKAEKLGTGLYRVTVYLQNEGWLPTSLAQARRSLTAYPLRASLKLNEQQRLFAGRPVEMIPVLQSGESKKLEWTVQAKKGSNLKVIVWGNRINPVEVTIKLD
ncbi:MAG TPA: M14 family metallopeptidase [Candidatus Saccharicenans sp.]|nr:M14 family metallopeptidase [Candidatus Saccharicenans sp.]HQM75363.1 M14 family metallopeptidase [Candidatus Saccharicenans sp.]